MRRLIGNVDNERNAEPIIVEVGEHDLTGELGVYVDVDGKGDTLFLFKEEIVPFIDLVFKANQYIEFKQEDNKIAYEEKLKNN